ncbi:uncharacterized protein LOC109605800 [Aethina tumida]|uniref:uncharacterized protein LOC109605800 n=1 Tax=Aethina tumida TaxID=116153 RepID=UPI0021488D24|nr:uncharacterized protein LOC109605800 [Aethina tumida]XP_049819602.1 uncharacterized protein LOC109605800 [Aethina tumida]
MGVAYIPPDNSGCSSENKRPHEGYEIYLELGKQIRSRENLLPVLKRLREVMTTPSAPPQKDLTRGEALITKLQDQLLSNIFWEIDRNAEFVLQQDEIADLSFDDIVTITTSDTLQVKNELIVYLAVMKWLHKRKYVTNNKEASENIKCLNEITPEMKKLIMAPRYGLMTKEQFLQRTVGPFKGPDRKDLLDEIEINKILNYINKENTRPLPYNGSKKRIFSKEKYYNFEAPSRTQERKSHKLNSAERGLVNCLACWSAVFD